MATKLDETSIYISLKQLRHLLYRVQFDMPKSARIIYGTPLLESLGKCIASYVLAFTVNEGKLKYIEDAIGWFAVVRTDLEFIVQENIIHFKKREVKQGTDENGLPTQPEPRDEVNNLKVQIFTHVARVDGEMCAWQRSLAKGKPIRA